jgi:hypothetical protein
VTYKQEPRRGSDYIVTANPHPALRPERKDDPGVEGDQQVEAFLLADLSDDQAVGPHPQRLLDEAPLTDPPSPSRLACLVCMATVSGRPIWSSNTS